MTEYIFYEYFDIDKYVKRLDIFQSRYTIIETVKKRSNKFSCIVADTCGTKYFCKVISAEFFTDDELSIYKFLKNNPHTYVNKICNVFKSSQFVIIISEYIDGITLREYNDKDSMYNIFTKICEGLQHLHSNKIMHSDLKLDNIMVNNNLDPIIIDFDLSRKMDGFVVKSQNVSGTRFFMPPESVKYNVYTNKNDIWALGIIFYMLLTDIKIYYTDKYFFELEISNDIEFNLRKVYNNSNMAHLISQMTNKNYQKRPDINTVMYGLILCA